VAPLAASQPVINHRSEQNNTIVTSGKLQKKNDLTSPPRSQLRWMVREVVRSSPVHHHKSVTMD